MNHPNHYSSEFLNKIEAALIAEKNLGQPLCAAFDADGTLWATDLGEHFFNYIIQHQLVPLPKDPWAHYLNMKKVNNDPRPAYLWLAQIAKGIPLTKLRAWAEEAVATYQPLPIFADQMKLIQLLLKYQVEVFIVTASITWAVEPGARRLGLKESNVIGVETKVENGLITDIGHGVVTYKQGKVEALLKHTQGTKPFLASGNSSGDIQLLESATHFAIAINSVNEKDRIYQAEQELAAIAAQKNWPYFFFKN